MGLDGFSMANLGLHRDLTSSQHALEAEQLAKTGNNRKIQDVDGMSREEGIKKRDDNYNGGGYGASGRDMGNDETSSDENSDADDGNYLTKEEFEQAPERFQMRINPDNDTLELYDKYYSRVLERITTQDLVAMISKLNSASGILVNKKV